MGLLAFAGVVLFIKLILLQNCLRFAYAESSSEPLELTNEEYIEEFIAGLVNTMFPDCFGSRIGSPVRDTAPNPW